METDNLILEHLRVMRASQDRNENKLDMLIVRVSSLEGQMAAIHVDLAGVNSRLDHLGVRMERIEHRLDLADAPQGR